MTPPLATYRLQLRGGVRLDDAAALVPYLDELGVTHLYSSPLLRARGGSAHGYDVVDPTQLDPQVGAPEELAQLAEALRARGMGIVLDIVPNHAAASAENPFWEDVLAHGAASRYARWFDIDWDAGTGRTRGKILLPVLGERFARALEGGELRLALEDGLPRVRYHEHGFPLDPRTLAGVLEAPGRAPAEGVARIAAALAALRAVPPRERRPDAGAPRERAAVERAAAAHEALSLLREAQADPAARAHVAAAVAALAPPEGTPRLHALLEAQAYALVHWRRARQELNYRRFFDVNELAAVRVELPEVFAATHARVLEWVAAGWIDALRVDHVDGLLDPRGYLERLRSAAAGAAGARRVVVYVEKILGAGERLPHWPVAGTTGYEFLNELEAALIDAGGAAELEAGYRRLTGRTRGFAAAARRGKRDALVSLLATDVLRLVLRLQRIARRAGARPPPGSALHTAIVEAIVHLPVYRTYADGRPGSPAPNDRRLLEEALAAAAAGGRAQAHALGLLRDVLVPPPGPAPPDAGERLAFVQRFQQTSGPAAAKGVEDTAFYAHVPLLSRNEVGADPGLPLGEAVAGLHAANGERARRWPGTLLAATTHDTKRSADARARLDVLSEMPREWLAAVGRWRRWNRPHRTPDGARRLPDPNTEYYLYQTLVGVWPLAPGGAATALEEADRASLHDRLQEHLRKAAREAKTHTSWIDPDERFEAALARFVAALLPPEGSSPFLADVARTVASVAPAGLWNALARTLVHLTAPGVPDIYQGDELWSFALVDPDNRRPVDFETRRRLLREVGEGFGDGGGEEARRFARALAGAPEDGRVKLHVVHRALAARRAWPDLFTAGSYAGLEGAGERRAHLLAFARGLGDAAVVVAVPRLPLALLGTRRGPPLGAEIWGGTALPLPAGLRGRRWRNALTGATTAEAGGAIAAAELFADLPVALLTAVG